MVLDPGSSNSSPTNQKLPRPCGRTQFCSDPTGMDGTRFIYSVIPASQSRLTAAACHSRMALAPCDTKKVLYRLPAPTGIHFHRRSVTKHFRQRKVNLLLAHPEQRHRWKLVGQTGRDAPSKGRRSSSDCPVHCERRQRVAKREFTTDASLRC